MNVIPIVVVDFSLSNLTFQEDNECVHSLKNDQQNQYEIILESIVRGFVNIADKVMAVGLGGKADPNDKNATDIYPFMGEHFDLTFDIRELVARYKRVLGDVGISSPANYAPILNWIKELAQIESDNFEWRNYYNLIYITPGVVDDYDETLKSLKEIENLPMSVTAIKIMNEQLEGADDFMIMQMDIEKGVDLRTRDKKVVKNSYYEIMNKSKPLLIDREFMTVLHYADFTTLSVKFREEIAKIVPVQSQSYMEYNNIFAFDLKDQDYATQKSIEFKLRESLKNKTPYIQEVIAKRQSLVGLKEFIKTIELDKSIYYSIPEKGRDHEESKSQQLGNGWELREQNQNSKDESQFFSIPLEKHTE